MSDNSINSDELFSMIADAIGNSVDPKTQEEMAEWKDQRKFIRDALPFSIITVMLKVMDSLGPLVLKAIDNHENEDMRDAIMRSSIGQLVETRLKKGFDDFGTDMWGWDLERLTDECVEELVDMLIYSCLSFAVVSKNVDEEMVRIKSEEAVDWS